MDMVLRKVDTVCIMQRDRNDDNGCLDIRVSHKIMHIIVSPDVQHLCQGICVLMHRVAHSDEGDPWFQIIKERGIDLSGTLSGSDQCNTYRLFGNR